MDKMESKLLEDYITVQRENTKEIGIFSTKIVELTGEIKELRKSLSNGTLSRIHKKVEGLYFALVGLIVPLIWILIKTLK